MKEDNKRMTSENISKINWAHPGHTNVDDNRMSRLVFKTVESSVILKIATDTKPVNTFTFSTSRYIITKGSVRIGKNLSEPFYNKRAFSHVTSLIFWWRK